jgi:hypothetical protein
MSARAATTTDKEGATLEQLKKKVERLQNDLNGLNESLAASQRCQSELAAERKKLVLPARLSKNADAQKRLGFIDVELARVRQCISDDAGAIAELGTQLTAAEQAVELAEWETRRATIRSLLMKRADGAKMGKLIETARRLAADLEALAEEDRLVATELRLFAPCLSGCATAIARLDHARAIVFTLELRNVVRADTAGLHVEMLKRENIEEGDLRTYLDAVEDLDQMEPVF